MSKLWKNIHPHEEKRRNPYIDGEKYYMNDECVFFCVIGYWIFIFGFNPTACSVKISINRITSY